VGHGPYPALSKCMVYSNGNINSSDNILVTGCIGLVVIRHRKFVVVGAPLGNLQLQCSLAGFGRPLLSRER